jgi:hypothetical protein
MEGAAGIEGAAGTAGIDGTGPWRETNEPARRR